MSDRSLRTIGIIGAGATGAAIATYALLGGYRVMLEDISAVRISEARTHITLALQAAVASHRLDSTGTREIGANFSVANSIDEVSRAADLLIEAAPKDAELQLEIFTIFDRFAKPHAILASMASAIPIADLAEITIRPERCVGFQFPEAGAGNDTVRIVRTPETSELTLQTCADFARAVGFAPEIVSGTAFARAAREART